jgi:hypothetical protein
MNIIGKIKDFLIFNGGKKNYCFLDFFFANLLVNRMHYKNQNNTVWKLHLFIFFSPRIITLFLFFQVQQG